MEFRTKLDYSDNRQIKQREGTTTTLSATTIFGMPFSGLTSGPNLSTTAQTSQYFGVVSTYSGNSATTIFTWGIPNVSIIEQNISALTPSNSGVSYIIDAVFAPSSSTIIDGNTVNLTYSGVSSPNFYALTMTEPTPGNYTGTVSTDFFIYSAQSLDFTGRTIWVDNTEILRTKRLIVSNLPQIGYVLTCSDSEGMASWQSVSAVTSGTTFWSASSGTNAIVLEYSDSIASGTLAIGVGSGTTAYGNYSHAEGYGSLASGDSSHSEGYFTTAVGNYSHVEGQDAIASGISSHAEGYFTTAIGYGSHSEGQSAIASGDSSHAEGYDTTAGGWASHAEGGYYDDFNNFYSGGISIGRGSHAEGRETIADGHLSHAEGAKTIAMGISSHAEGVQSKAIGHGSHAEGGYCDANNFYYSGGTAIGIGSHAEGRETTTIGNYSHAEGDKTTASGNYSHAEGSGTTSFNDYSHSEGYGTKSNGVSSHAEGSYTTSNGISSHSEGDNTTAIGDMSHSGGYQTSANGDYSFVHGFSSVAQGTNTIVFGSSITGTSNNTVYVPDLVIDGLVSTDPIATDANGKIVAGTSDIRLKQNINTLTNALDVINKLRGVSFEYTEESNMGSGVRFGFIAQEVQEIVPDMVRFRAKNDGMLNLNYTEVIPWIVEAIKDLTKTNISNSELVLETQTAAAEDNNIELNYNGTKDTALNGGITIINGLSENVNAEFKINSDGNWVTNNLIIPKGLIIPKYTPTSSSDIYGKNGEITTDENYLYIKVGDKWKRSMLDEF